MVLLGGPPREMLVAHWIEFIWAMEDHYAATRQADAEARAVAEQVAAFSVHLPTSRPSQRDVVTADP